MYVAEVKKNQVIYCKELSLDWTHCVDSIVPLEPV